MTVARLILVSVFGGFSLFKAAVAAGVAYRPIPASRQRVHPLPPPLPAYAVPPVNPAPPCSGPPA